MSFTVSEYLSESRKGDALLDRVVHHIGTVGNYSDDDVRSLFLAFATVVYAV